MMSRSCFLSALFLVFCLSPVAEVIEGQTAADAGAAAQPVSKTEQWREGLAAWRAQREQQIAAPGGPLTLVGMEWLKPGFNKVGSGADNEIRLRAEVPEHIGMLTVSGKVVQLLAPAGGFPAELEIDGEPAREGPLTVVGKPSTIAWHGLTMTVVSRGGRFALLAKDANAAKRTEFKGLKWYAPDPHLRVIAEWVPFKPAHIEQIPTAAGPALGLTAPGFAEFVLDDKAYTLEPVMEDPAGKTLFFILRDETSTTTTYETGRYLHTGLPDKGLDEAGYLTLDFNELENPPCAYTTYATCPLAPEQNRLGVALEAGEERYSH